MKARNIFRSDVGSVEYRANMHDPEVRVLQADNAREYEKLGRIIFSKYGTHAQFTNAYTPEQNGVAERRMRTIMERVRALLIDGKLPKTMWAECLGHVTTLINMTPSSATNERTPYELWYNRLPSIEFIKVFGCAAYAHIPERYRDKLDSRAHLCVYLGVPKHKKGYRLMDIESHDTVYSRDVKFDERTYPNLAHLTESSSQKEASFPLTTLAPTLGSDPTSTNRAPSATSTNGAPSATATSQTSMSDAQHAWLRVRDELKRNHYTFVSDASNQTSIDPASKRQRSALRAEPSPAPAFSTETTKDAPLLDSPEDQEEIRKRTELVYTLLAIRYITEPNTYKKAMISEHAPQWDAATKSEYSSHMTNGTWVLVPPPPGRKILQNRWVFVVKYKGDGSIDRFKARLVIKGFLQQHGIDYDEIFSPVIRMEVLRLLLTIAALLNFEVHQMDVKTAFLHGVLDVEIYMEQPEGFVVPGQEQLVCKLLKSLYGLKQAPRVWYQTLCTFLETLNFHRIIKDRCVFIGIIDGLTCYIAVYVDDLLIIAPTLRIIQHIKDALKQKFHMTDLGEAKYLLGWSIIRNRMSRTIFIHQHKYATTVLDRFKEFITYPAATPCERNLKLTVDMHPTLQTDIDTMSTIPYREAVGSMMYLMVGTRPDLAYFMREVSQFLSNPGQAHWRAVLRGLRYLHGTSEYGITLGGTSRIAPAKLADSLTAYTDSDYANCPDTRRSVGGYVTLLGNSPISWLSRKHHTVVLSTTEAEYVALCHCMQEMIFLKLLLKELGFATTTSLTIHEDNQSCIKISNNPELHGRSKHIDIRYHFVQEKVERHEFVVTYCSTKQMIADIFTKALDKHRFRALRDQLGVRPQSNSS